MKHRFARGKGDHVIWWIENFCLAPDGPGRGRPVRLSEEQRQEVKRIYDGTEPIERVRVKGELAAYLALIHTCGPLAPGGRKSPDLEIDSWSIWRATSERLRAVLKRDGERIVCLELGTHFPSAA